MPWRAVKRPKNEAHGASRGWVKPEVNQPRRGERNPALLLRRRLAITDANIGNGPITKFQITKFLNYSICTSPPEPTGVACCGARHESKIDTWCTHDTVQCGAHDFSVKYSRRISATVYFSSGTPG